MHHKKRQNDKAHDVNEVNTTNKRIILVSAKTKHNESDSGVTQRNPTIHKRLGQSFPTGYTRLDKDAMKS